MLSVGALAERTTRNAPYIMEVYDLTNTSMYQLRDSTYPDGWLAITGHQYQMSISSDSDNLSYKSSRGSVATISRDGTITAKRDGVTYITVHDRSVNCSIRFRLRVLKNQSSYVDGGDWDDEVYGVYSKAKRIYLRGSTLYVEMYIMNATNNPIRNVGPQQIYMDCAWTDDHEFNDFYWVGSWSGRISTIQPGRSRTATIRLNRVDTRSIYLRNADAYCMGGIVRGHLDGY